MPLRALSGASALFLSISLVFGCPGALPEPDCAPGFEAVDGVCEDIDECAVDNGGCGDPEVCACIDNEGAPPDCDYDWSIDYAALTEGVAVIESGGSLPSSLVVHGVHAMPLVLDENGRTFMAASRAGEGRVVVFGHESYLGGGLSAGDMEALALNAARWATAGVANPTVGLAPGFDGLGNLLAAEGFTVRNAGPGDLDGLDLFAAPTSNSWSEQELQALRDFYLDGGGLLAAGQGWYWAFVNERDAAAEYPGSILLRDAGITYTGDTDVQAGSDVVPEEPPAKTRQARYALLALTEHVSGGDNLGSGEQLEAVAAAGLAVTHLPLDESEFFAGAGELSSELGPLVLNESAPLVRADAPIDELVVRIDTRFHRDLPAGEVWAHPAGEDFPGRVPGDAPRVRRELSLSGDHDGRPGEYIYSGAGAAAWRSTGLYAAPGDRFTLSIPAAFVGAGLSVAVGAHSDRLYGADTWNRYPELVRVQDLDAESVEVGSLFGGLIYIRVPSGSELGSIDVTIDGAVEAPRWVQGETSPAAWTGGIRDLPGPWAELESDKVVLTLPSEAVRTLDDPAALMDFWDDILDSQAELSGLSTVRERAERIVFDRQISAGWMHSGYPIMAHLPSVESAVSLSSLSTVGDWGFFHELGHNHQWGEWMLPGTTEANVNLFSVYTMEEVVGLDRSLAHPAVADADRAARIDTYIAGGRDFSRDWNVWTALETYLQLQEGFGWQPFTDAFTLYRDPLGPDPAGDQQRIDTWASVFSNQVDRDLGPFFTAWGFPLSQWVLDEMAARPTWTEDPMAGR